MKPYFYKVTNIINNFFYYGSGSKANYLGSGKLLKSAISKYGKENFKIEMLKFFDTREEAFLFEKRFLSLYDISSLEDSYNLCNDGCGGNKIDYDGENSAVYRENSKKAILVWNKSEDARNTSRKRLIEKNPMDDHDTRQKCINVLAEWKKENGNYMQGKNHSLESKQKMSKTRKERNIQPHNKGKILEKNILCERCNRNFSSYGIKKHQKTCKAQ